MNSRAVPTAAAGTPKSSPWRSLLVVALLVTLPGSLAAQGESRRGKSEGRATSNAGGAVRTAVEEFQAEKARRELQQPPNELPIEGDQRAAEGVGLAGAFQPEQLVSPGGLSSTINLMILLTVLSLAPSVLIMTTCFIRFVVVLGLLRQALGTQQLPPNQVLLALSLFLTFMVMMPVWQQSYEEGILPYTNPVEGEPAPSLAQTFENSVRPIRRFMCEQIDKSGNKETVWMFLDYQQATAEASGKSFAAPENYDKVPLATLVSAYMLSELKAAFTIGFQIYLPFLIIDMVVATVLMSMGMMMLPPTLVSFPFKLLLFVLIDGWALTVGMMLASVQTSG
jgi:flagellar biosynthesis protein FliP